MAISRSINLILETLPSNFSSYFVYCVNKLYIIFSQENIKSIAWKTCQNAFTLKSENNRVKKRKRNRIAIYYNVFYITGGKTQMIRTSSRTNTQPKEDDFGFDVYITRQLREMP